jgi:hypothetical protein
VFEEAVVEIGGRVTELSDDGERLFARSLFPDEREVRRGDRLQGGVAVMAAGHEVRIHPYVFRQVCSNGAIMAHSAWARRIELPDWPADGGHEVLEQVAEALRACGAADAFAAGVRAMRSALDLEADFARTVLPLLDHLPAGVRSTMMGMIAGRFFGQPARSRFALMNAVTSVARDQTDPELRWRLEEIGGGIPGMKPVPRRAVGVVVAASDAYAHA